MNHDLLLTFYGDDYTGSTDVLQSLSLYGVETVLFLEIPKPIDVEAFEDVQAIGIAGTSRSMSPAKMTEELKPAFEALNAFNAPLCQYKICSTFDSSPKVGSIGHAIDVAQGVFDSPFVPVVVAAPSLEPRGRYVVFGNLFAQVNGVTHRLDRHPTMRNHPITPMNESDLACHLSEQTERSITTHQLLDYNHADSKRLQNRLDETLSNDDEIVIFDGLNHDHQTKVGHMIWERCRQNDSDDSFFSASSSGLNYALATHWKSAGIVESLTNRTTPDPVEKLLVMSGSASPVNGAQIDWALDNGFEGIRLDTARLIDPDTATAARKEAIEASFKALDQGMSPLLYSARGPNDPAIETTNKRFNKLGSSLQTIGRQLGEQQGQITRSILNSRDLDRICIAGGDTSGCVAQAIEIYALQFASNVAPGCPLCRATSRIPTFDDLSLSLKGGQCETTNDESDYFEVVRQGGTL